MRRTVTAAASLAAFTILALAVGSLPANADAVAGENLLDYVAVNAAPTLVPGGLQFDGTTTGGAAVDAFHAEQTPLASVTELGFDVAVAPSDGQADPAYALQVNTGDGGAVTLSAEPVQNGLAADAAGGFDVSAWKFWSSGIAASDDGGQENPEPLSWFDAQYPSAAVVGHGIRLAGATASAAIVSSTSFNGAITDFTLGTQANPIQTQAAPNGSIEIGPANLSGIDPQTGVGTLDDLYTADSAFGTVYYHVHATGVKDPDAIIGLSAPIVAQPQGGAVATNGLFVWHETAQGTITVPSVAGGTWSIDGTPVAAGSPISEKDGRHSVTFTPAAGHAAYPSDLPAGVAVGTDGTVSFAVTLTPGTASGAAKVTVSKAPYISGTAQVGKPLTANIGTISPSGATVSYQWLLNGAVITSGGTGKTFTPASAGYIGKKLSVRITVKATGYTSYSGTSPQTAAVRTGVLVSAVPGITGSVKVGQKLTAKAGTWTAGTTLTYQWFANGRAIAGERGTVLTLRPAQVNTKIGLRITGAKSGYTTVVRTSPATAPVAPATLVASTPKVTSSSSYAGAPLVGATLRANVGSWTAGTSFRFQWYANSTPIAGATSSTFTIPASMTGRTFHVAVKGTKAGYTTVTKISANTAKAYNPGSASAKAAITDAKDYLKYIGNSFSRTGLIKQLEFDRFSALDSSYAVDSLHINFNTAAANDAADYVRYIGGFSYGSMVGQLEFDGFTAAQAAYGAHSVGL